MMEERKIQVKLAAFEGPLDLLLHLIEKAEMAIEDVAISEITSHYLAYMDQLESLDMDRASDFLFMAATLIYIKSCALLPRPAKLEQEEGEDPKEKLLRQLREYKQYKEMGEVFAQMEESAAHIYVRLPEEFLQQEQAFVLEQGDVNKLWKAFRQLLLQKEAPLNPERFERLRKDTYTIEASMEKMRRKLRLNKRIAFCQLFQSGEKMELVVGFMAILELFNLGELDVEQENAFSELYLIALDKGEDLVGREGAFGCD